MKAVQATQAAMDANNPEERAKRLSRLLRYIKFEIQSAAESGQFDTFHNFSESTNSFLREICTELEAEGYDLSVQAEEKYTKLYINWLKK